MQFQLFTIILLGFVVTLVARTADTNENVTSDKSAYIAQLESVITRIEKMREKIRKTNNESSSAGHIDFRHYNLLAKGYQLTPDVGYHKLYLKQMTWNDALHQCRKDNAHLAVISSADEGPVNFSQICFYDVWMLK